MDAATRVRRRLLARLDHEFRATSSVTGRATASARVGWALSAVPRDAFLEPGERADAWMEGTIPFGHGQLLSRAFLLALTTELLDLSPDDVVLEVGTGSGYQAALFGVLARQVVSVELDPRLAARARERLDRIGLRNVELLVGDGAVGLPASAPFDAIVVSRAVPTIPRALLEQLRAGGRLVVPVGSGAGQQLLFVRRDQEGRISWQSVLPLQLRALRDAVVGL